ncbi:MAG TPA: hypothetical protein PL009_13455 [Flavipsychrobacter sp.]|nr:hypothetical protein [Flavipsychrobacter sp.]
MSYFRWPYTVLFRGATTPAGELSPWYLPIWIGISTLVVWLVVFVFGIGAGLVAWLRKPLEFFYNTPHRHIVLYLYLAIAPLTMVIALGSIVYDDWRHLYFIYPALVMLGLYGVTKLKNKGLSRIVLVLIFMQSGVAAYQLIKLHPFQIVYFNSLVSHDEEALRHNYEMDYWGTGYKQALEYLIANAPEQEIKIVRGKPPLIFNVDILQVQDRPRIKFVEEAEATYFVTNFRTHPEDYPYPNVVYEIKRQNSTILRIYKLR